MPGRLDLAGESLRLYFPYAEAQQHLAEIRALPGAKWDAAIHARILSAAPADLPAILAFAARHGVRVDPAIVARAKSAAAVQDAQAVGSDARALDPRLYPFQREGVRWLARQDRALLADAMGTGKTVQILAALPERAPVAVVCPASLKGNWRNEFARWRPDYTVTVLSGRGSFRWPAPGEAVVANYDILPTPDGLDAVGQCAAAHVAAFLRGEACPAVQSTFAAPAGLVLVVDEAHAVKGSKTARTKAVAALADSAARAVAATGTPLLNRPMELWTVLDTFGLAERAFGTAKRGGANFGRFYRLFNAYRTKWGTEWGRPEPEVPDLLKRVMLRRERKDVLPDLPAKRWQDIPVNGLSASLRKRLDATMSEWEEWRRDARAKKLDDGLPPFEMMSEVRELLAEAKCDALVDRIEEYEEAGEPLVVFSAHRAPVEVCKAREGWAVIYGDTPNEQRTEIVEAFQAGKLKGIAGTIRAMGTGVTLTRAHSMLFVDLDWTPALNEQAEDRICRIGATGESVLYETLVAEHPLDERVNELLQTKRELTDATIGAAAVTEVKTLTETLASLPEVEEAPPPEPTPTRTCPRCQRDQSRRVAGPTSKNPGRAYFSCRPCDWFEWEDAVALPTVTCPRCGKQAHEHRTGDTHRTPGRPYARCGACGFFGWLADRFDDGQRARAFSLASDTEQRWAAESLFRLLSVCDGAVTEDGAGFNKPDSGPARQYAYRLAAGHPLDAGQWADLLDRLAKYRHTQLEAT